jgi:predicted nucleotidyltransferase
MELPGIQLRPNHQAFADRFVKACQADNRIVAAFLGGSNVKGTADAYSDIDLSVITKDQAFEEFFKEREAFLRSLGDLVFLEDFDISDIAFFMFADDTEGELYFGRENQMDHIHSGPFQVLLDKKNILTGAVFSEPEPALSEQIEKLRRHIQWFWHELSHFITALGRGQLWWAQSQLEALRSICINLVRLRNNILDGDAGEEAYFKIENMMPVEQLAALQDTFPPLEKEAILKAGLAILHFYREIAPPLAQTHGLHYSHELERVMMDRLQKLQDANLA